MRGIPTAQQEALQEPNWTPFSLLPLLLGASKAKLLSQTPEVLADLAKRGVPRGLLESPTIETTGKQVWNDAATNFANWRDFGDSAIGNSPERLRKLYQPIIENLESQFSSYIRDLEDPQNVAAFAKQGKPIPELLNHLKSFQKLAAVAARDTGPRPYMKHVVSIFQRALKEADRQLGL